MPDDSKPNQLVNVQGDRTQIVLPTNLPRRSLDLVRPAMPQTRKLTFPTAGSSDWTVALMELPNYSPRAGHNLSIAGLLFGGAPKMDFERHGRWISRIELLSDGGLNVVFAELPDFWKSGTQGYTSKHSGFVFTNETEHSVSYLQVPSERNFAIRLAHGITIDAVSSIKRPTGN